MKLAYFGFPMAHKGAEIWGKEANVLAHVLQHSLLLTSRGNQVLCILPLPLLNYKILFSMSSSPVDKSSRKVHRYGDIESYYQRQKDKTLVLASVCL